MKKAIVMMMILIVTLLAVAGCGKEKKEGIPQSTDVVDGFGHVQWGMSISQVESLIGEHNKFTYEGNTYLDEKNPNVMKGQIRYSFTDKALSRVNMRYNEKQKSGILSYLNSKYGKPEKYVMKDSANRSVTDFLWEKEKGVVIATEFSNFMTVDFMDKVSFTKEIKRIKKVSQKQ